MPGLSEFLKSSAERLPAGPGSQLLGREETEPSWRGCRVRDGAALPGRWWPRRGDRRESPPPTRGCSSFRGRARQPPAPPRGRWGHYHSLGLPSTHAGLLAPDWHQRVSRGFSWGLEGMTYMYLCVPRGAPGTRCVLCSLQLTLPFFRVFFCFLAVPADCDKKSWQNRAEPLSPRETQQCVSAGCGWEIKLGAGEAGDGAAVSPIPGVCPSRRVSWSIGFLQAQRGGCRNNFARCATGVCQRERRCFCQEVAEKELGRL